MSPPLPNNQAKYANRTHGYTRRFRDGANSQINSGVVTGSTCLCELEPENVPGDNWNLVQHCRPPRTGGKSERIGSVERVARKDVSARE
jgi:hypothetical protein